MNEHLLITDWHDVQPRLQEQGSRVDTEIVAMSLKQMAHAIGGSVKLHAVVSDQDEAARRAFEKARFRIWSVNGDRRRQLDRLKEEVEDRVLERYADRLTLVTTDPALGGLVRLATKVDCQVRVWGTSSTPGELRQYGFQPLEELLPELRVRRVVVLVDWENISISLAQAGWVVNPETVAETFKQQAIRYGKVHAIYAYADWGALTKSQGQDVQRLLEMSGIATRYEVSMRGKSSSDMRIMDKAHKLLQGSDAPDVLVLATGDRDFRALIETARQRFGKTVVLWGKKGTVSPRVSEVADEVEWVDDFLHLPRQGDLKSISRSARHAEETLIDPRAELALKVESLLRSQGWEWVSHGKLLDTLAPSSDPHARSVARDWIYQAKAEGVLLSEQKANPRPDANKDTLEALSLNPDHPSVKAARLVRDRAHDRVRHALEVRRMPYVTFSYVANGMGMDTELEKAGLARTRAEQMHWLNLLVEAGFLLKERRTTPHNCTVLWLPKENPTPAAPDDPETMVRRLVTRADTFMMQRSLDWVALGWLHKQLLGFGNTVFQEMVDRLTQAGEAEKQHHENPNRPQPTLGLHLDPQGATVAAIRQERESILATLNEKAADGKALSIESLQAHLGEELQPDVCARWVAVLADEGVLLRRGDVYHLNRNHTLLRELLDSETQASPIAMENGSVGQLVAGAPSDEEPTALTHDHALLEKPSEGETQVPPVTVESGDLRQLVTEALSDEELTTLTFDRFRTVYERFAEGMPKSKKVHMLVEYVERRGLVQRLLAELRQMNPVRVAEFVPQMAAA